MPHKPEPINIISIYVLSLDKTGLEFVKVLLPQQSTQIKVILLKPVPKV